MEAVEGIDDESKPKLPQVFGVAAVSPAAIEQAHYINVVKNEFRMAHERLRACFDTGAKGTDAMNTVLRRCGEVRLSLDAVDLNIPIVDTPILSLSWHYNKTVATHRRTLNDSIIELYRLRDEFGEPMAAGIDADIERLEQSSYGGGHPLSEKLRPNLYESLRVAYTYRGSDGLSDRITLYGRNPVLIPIDPVTPKISIPREYRGNKVAAGRGRKKSVSDRCVSQFLPHWFFYNDPDKEMEARRLAGVAKSQDDISAVPTKSQNPFAKTALPGIWFSLSRSGTPVFAFRINGGQRSSRSIQKLGLQGAWSQAVEHHEYGLAIELKDAYIELCPSKEALLKFMDSLDTAA
jgi:hypothetical protein